MDVGAATELVTGVMKAPVGQVMYVTNPDDDVVDWLVEEAVLSPAGKGGGGPKVSKNPSVVRVVLAVRLVGGGPKVSTVQFVVRIVTAVRPVGGVIV